jgi:hypothetical protein
MSKKIGRPKVAKNEAKNILVGAMVSPPEAKEIETKVAQSQQSKSEWVRSKLLGPMENAPSPSGPSGRHNYQNFPVVCPNARQLYGGSPAKIAVFQVEHRGKLHVLSGTFLVHEKGGKVFIVLRSYGSAEVPGMDYYLDQAHVESIAPLPEPASKAAYIIREPFLSRHHAESSKRRPSGG